MVSANSRADRDSDPESNLAFRRSGLWKDNESFLKDQQKILAAQ